MPKAVAQANVSQLSDVTSNKFWTRASTLFCEVSDDPIVKEFYFAPIINGGSTFKVCCRACHRSRGRPLEYSGGGKFARQKDGRWLLVATRDEEDLSRW